MKNPMKVWRVCGWWMVLRGYRLPIPTIKKTTTTTHTYPGWPTNPLPLHPGEWSTGLLPWFGGGVTIGMGVAGLSGWAGWVGEARQMGCSGSPSRARNSPR